ncbi:MAG: HAMP domain-containing histidine kinase [Erysipelotrichaceae bacterium]|jgi:signal transduction histidine kinase|nr:HAMP domain-containing histidine kinase [Erysipelotrichaceae bacterium]
MRKFNGLIAGVVLFYIILAVSGFWLLSATDKDSSHAYRIEINRSYHAITEQGSLDAWNGKDCRYVEDVAFLSASASFQETSLFFEEENRPYHIRPWYDSQQLKGYLKFFYKEPVSHTYAIWILEAVLLMIACAILALLLYIKKHLILPFIRLRELPEELAKGHYKGEIKEEKNRYLGQFLWGMSQLKDCLDTSRKRQMELEKEKKQMLLSLSHDIRTPLNLIKLYGSAIEKCVYEKEEDILYAAHQIGEKTNEIDVYVDALMKASREDILDIRVHIDEFYLKDLVEAVREEFQELCDIQKIDLSIGTYENRLLRGDIHRLQEVLENLFDNAVKYGDGGRIEMTFYEEDYCQMIRLYNTGECVDEQDLIHIFESFFRGRNSSGKPGYGMGLYICKEIMRKLDGEIFVQKDKGGISFTIVLR